AVSCLSARNVRERAAARTARGLLGAAAAGYLAGTIPSADLAARLATAGRVDLRSAGTGNPGGANALVLLGRRWGYSVIVADIAKGALASVAGRRLGGPAGAHLAGTAAVVGHCFPVWNGFRGGKGVGASAGQCLATFPAWFPADVALAWVMAVPRWRQRTRAAATITSVAWVAAALLWWRRGWPNLWGPRASVALPAAAAASSAVILYRFATMPWLGPPPAPG
ncbi:MAG: glycerol-3-phosphate acyltransferase, partial [Acidimicrobiales bacterium]